MTKYIAVLALVVWACAGANIAAAAPGSLRVVGASQSSGASAITSADAIMKSHAIYVRAYGRMLSAYVVTSCTHGFSIGTNNQKFSLRSGVLQQLKLPNGGGDCDVTASLSGSGSIRLQILARMEPPLRKHGL